MNLSRRIAIVLAIACIAPLDASFAASRGEKVYDRTCTVCHDEGLSGAPKLGNRNDWATRVAAGPDELVKSVKGGKGLMPPKGGNDKFSEEDLRAAVEYMLAKLR